MSPRARAASSTEDIALADGVVLTISVEADRMLTPTPVAVGHDAQARGAWWLQDEQPLPVAHRVRVGERGSRLGGWQRKVRSADEADQLVAALRTALLAGWRPENGDPVGL